MTAGNRWLRVAGAIAALALFGLPLAALGIDAMRALAVDHSLVRLAIPSGRTLTLLVRSCVLAGTTAVVCLVAGTAASLALPPSSHKAGWLKLVLFVPMVIPPYIHALAWMRSAEWLRRVAATVDIRLPAFQGFGAVVWVQAMVYLPLAAGVALAAWSMIEPQLADAALMRGSRDRTLWRVMVPLASPVLLSGAVLVFVLCVGDLAIPSLLSVNTYALELYARFSSTGRTSDVTLLAVPIVLLCLTALAPAIRSISAAVSAPATREGVMRSAWHPSAWMQFLCTCAVVLLAADSAGLTISLMNGLRGATWVAVADALPSVWVSGRVAIFACAFSTILAVLLGPLINNTSPLGRSLCVLILIPLALPGPLAGTGAVLATSALRTVGLAQAVPALLMAFRFAPFACLMTAARLARTDAEAIDAGRVFERRRGDWALRVWLPMLLPVLVAALLLVAVLVVGEVGGSLMVMPPGQQPLSITIYNYLHYGASGSVSALCLVLFAAVFLLCVPGYLSWRKAWRFG
jgi:iron(III) transport system permease protein